MPRPRSLLIALALGVATLAAHPITSTAEPNRPAPLVELTAPTSTTAPWAGLAYAVHGRRAAEQLWYSTVAAQAAAAETAGIHRRPAGQSRTAASSGRSGHRGYGSARECVANVENGGSYDRGGNPTHVQKYQFSYSTWVAYGGNPDTWGHASPAEQEEVFDRAWNSPGGPSNWLPYDGC